MKNIPDGFKKMDLILTFENKLVETIEMKIIHHLVRDYYIFYSKIPKFDGKTWTEFHFYCRPKDETSIAYRIGCYAQALVEFYTKKSFENAIHTVPEKFPECVHIPASYNEKHQLLVGDRFFENGEAAHEIDPEGAFFKSKSFTDGFTQQVIKDTWGKGLPMVYLDDKNRIVEHWSDGRIKVIKRLLTKRRVKTNP